LSISALLVCSFVLALAGTFISLWLMDLFGVMPDQPEWRGVMANMDIVWFVLIAFCAMYMMIGYYVSMQEESARALRANASVREAELRALRYQIHPHFLFNTLNAISTLVAEERTRDATRMIAKLGDFLRMTLDGNDAHDIELNEELALTESYLDIEKTRLGDRLDVVLEIDADCLHASVPRLLLQPLVENAIRHGIAPRVQGGRLDIKVSRVGERVRIRLENSGIADRRHAKNNSGEEPSGLGLRNVRERLGHIYGDDHSFAFQHADDGHFLVVIDLPFQPRDSIAMPKAVRP
ncbi:MAG: histidine kinase, partial [Pseudomonadota bacterium]|nr:histidine kinase [Pseudomonadota bacterium]